MLSFTPARQSDDAGIRRLLRRTPMAGDVTVRYEREPSFFASLEPMGPTTQVTVARAPDDPETVVALGCRSLQSRYLQGTPHRTAYLHSMRVDPDWRGQGLVNRGFRAIRRWHAADPVDVTTIALTAGNPAARVRLVDRPPPAVPPFHPAADLHTLALIPQRRFRRRPDPVPGLSVIPAANNLDAAVAFLNRAGRAQPLFPVVTREGLTSSAWRDFHPSTDLLVARHHGRIVGTLGLWDVSGHKQTVVQSYRGVLRWTRPLLNIALRLLGPTTLPDPGRPMSARYTCLPCVDAPEPTAVYAHLLDRALRRTARDGASFLLVGAATGHPLLPAARTHRHVSYRSTLYRTAWTNADTPDSSIDALFDAPLPPYVELATL